MLNRVERVLSDTVTKPFSRGRICEACAFWQMAWFKIRAPRLKVEPSKPYLSGLLRRALSAIGHAFGVLRLLMALCFKLKARRFKSFRVYRVLSNSFDKMGCTASVVCWRCAFHLFGNPLGWQGIPCPRNRSNATRSSYLLRSANSAQTPRKPFARRALRGFNLIETSLALGVFVIAITSGTHLWSEHVFRKALNKEAEQLNILANAAKRHLLFDLKQNITQARFTDQDILDISIDDLTNTESYSFAAPRQTVRGRDMSVFYWAPTPTSVIVFTQAKYPEGKSGKIGAARHDSKSPLIGWVPPYKATHLVGAGLNYDISHLQAAGRTITPGDFLALEYLSLGRDVSPYLHRKLDAQAPELNQMETHLDLNGNDILNVGALNAQDIVFTQSLEAPQLTGTLTVEGSVTIEGNLDVTQSMTVESDATITGTTKTDKLTVAQDITTSVLTANSGTFETIETANLVSTGTVSAAQAVTTNLTATTANTTSGEAVRLETQSLFVDANATASDVLTTTLTTGSCTGC